MAPPSSNINAQEAPPTLTQNPEAPPTNQYLSSVEEMIEIRNVLILISQLKSNNRDEDQEEAKRLGEEFSSILIAHGITPFTLESLPALARQDPPTLAQSAPVPPSGVTLAPPTLTQLAPPTQQDPRTLKAPPTSAPTAQALKTKSDETAHRVLIARILELESEVHDKDKEIRDLKKMENQYIEVLEKKNSEVQHQKHHVEKLNLTIHHFQKSKENSEVLIQALKVALENQKALGDVLQKNLESSKSRCQKLEDQILPELEKNILEMEGRIQKFVVKENLILKTSLDKKTSELRAYESQNQILKTSLEQKTLENANLKKDLNQKTLENLNLTEDLNQMTLENQNRQELVDCERELHRIRLKMLQRANEDLEESLNQMKTENSEVLDQIRKTDVNLKRAIQQRDETRNQKYNVLKNLERVKKEVRRLNWKIFELEEDLKIEKLKNSFDTDDVKESEDVEDFDVDSEDVEDSDDDEDSESMPSLVTDPEEDFDDSWVDSGDVGHSGEDSEDVNDSGEDSEEDPDDIDVSEDDLSEYEDVGEEFCDDE